MTNFTNTRAAARSSAASPLVLVLEDHEDTRILLRALLEMKGYCVLEAVDGEDAVRQAETLTPDLILMEGSLPRIDGFSAMRLIREDEGLLRVPVIFLSGHALPAAREAAFAYGCDDYLTKPLDTDQLYHTIEKHITQRKPLALVKNGANLFGRDTT